MMWKTADLRRFEDYVKMTEKQFDELYSLVKPIIQKQDTKMKISVPGTERLVMALAVLYYGHTYAEMSRMFKVSMALFTELLPEVYGALYAVLKDSMSMPRSKPEWLQISEDFEEKYIFPRCVGVLDSRQLTIKKAVIKAIVIRTVVDSNARFRHVDFYKEGICTAPNDCLDVITEAGTLNLPDPQPLVEGGDPVPFVFVANNSFESAPYLVKPYRYEEEVNQNQIFNAGLFNTFQASEKAFKSIVNRFQILSSPFNHSATNVKKIMRAIFVLHNFHLDTMETEEDMFATDTEEMPTNNILSLTRFNERENEYPDAVRESIGDYFLQHYNQDFFQVVHGNEAVE